MAAPAWVACVLAALAVGSGQARFACSRRVAAQRGLMHITCLRRNAACDITDDRPLGPADRHEILLAHNRIRRDAAHGLLAHFGLPAAANMKKLEWDDDLSNNAQAHVEVTCKLKHDQPGQRTTVTYPDVGQNIYITEVWGQELVPDSWSKVIEDLWGRDEAAKLQGSTFGPGLTLKGHDLRTIGHLTQLLWADTEKVGCGKIVYRTRRGGQGDLRTCDYGEGGNVIGAAVYTTGAPCSACPDSHPYCDDGLCSRVPLPVSYANVYSNYVPTAPPLAQHPVFTNFISTSSSRHESYEPPATSRYTYWQAPGGRQQQPHRSLMEGKPTQHATSQSANNHAIQRSALTSHRHHYLQTNQVVQPHLQLQLMPQQPQAVNQPYYSHFKPTTHAHYSNGPSQPAPAASYQPNVRRVTTVNYRGYAVLIRRRKKRSTEDKPGAFATGAPTAAIVQRKTVSDDGVCKQSSK